MSGSPMINRLRIETVFKDNRKVMALRGSIDEDAQFDSLLGEKGTLYIDFEGVTSINSLGVRSWVNFLKALGNRTIHYENCPPIVVRQLNRVPSFLGKAAVDSVYVPYICDSCEKEVLILISKNALEKSPVNIPGTFSCEACKNGEMEIDGRPEQYFAFKR